MKTTSIGIHKRRDGCYLRVAKLGWCEIEPHVIEIILKPEDIEEIIDVLQSEKGVLTMTGAT
jgi:uncharacterized protein (DUF169 family)